MTSQTLVPGGTCRAGHAITSEANIVIHGGRRRCRACVAIARGAGRTRQDLAREVAEAQASFDLRWKADMRAIKMWQEAHPGNDLVWPDHADLVVWLLEQLDGCKRTVDQIPRILDWIP